MGNSSIAPMNGRRISGDSQERQRWLFQFRRNPLARLQLFCFPYAGVGASAFFPWVDELPANVELLAVQLPGRESRIREKPLDQLGAIVPLVAEAIRARVDTAYAFFGHSMGALIAFEVARYLRAEAFPGPVHLFASARRAPHRPDRLPRIHHLPQDEFIEALRRRWDGIPAAVLREPELLQLLLSSLRADVTAIETYTYIDGQSLTCPISVYGGEEDNSIEQDDLLSWREFTSGLFRLRMFPGNHFFIRTEHQKVIRAVVEDLLPVLPDWHGVAPC